MTKFSEKQIKMMSEDIIGKTVRNFYYEFEDDYFVIEFEDGTETSVRFMADLI